MALSLTDAPPPKKRPIPLALIVAMRPKQWTKNALLFAGLLFTLDVRHTAAQYERVVLAFAIFCLLSSVVYLINDVADQESDRQHPKKRRRPIASGDLPVPVAVSAAVVILAAALFGAFATDKAFFLAAVFYFLLTLLYSFRLKHVVILDVLVLAAGFVLRAIAGAVVIHVAISHWLILCTLMLALFLGLSKRRAELLATQEAGIGGTRRILGEYSAAMLDQMIVIVTSSCLMSYCLYTVQSEAASRHHLLMLTIPSVIFGIFRYLYLMHRHMLGESPDAILLEDRPTIVNIAIWGLAIGLIITHTLDRFVSVFTN